VALDDIPRHVRDAVERRPRGTLADRGGLRQSEDAIIKQALLESGGRVGEAARRMDVARTTIYRRLKRWAESE